MTISQALIVVLLISVFASATGTELASNTTILTLFYFISHYFFTTR